MSETAGSLERDRDEDVERSGDGWVDNTEATIQRYLPYVVGILFALGFLVFGGVQSCRSTEDASEVAGRVSHGAGNGALVAKVRAAELSDDVQVSNISADNGVVTLRGSVATEAEKLRAGELAEGVSGVSRVDNRLLVTGSGPTVQATATADAKGVVLAGEVPTEAVRKSLVAAATRTYGAAGVTDRLSVNRDASGYDLRIVGTVPAAIAAGLRADFGGVAPSGGFVDELALAAVVPAITAAPTTAALPATTAAPVTTARPATSATPVTTAAPATTAAPPPATPPASPLVDQLNAAVRAAPVLFDVELATLRPESIATLDRVAQLLLSRPDGRFEVQGHTDPRGGEAVNIPLSQERSDTVARYLISKGVPAARLDAKGYGSARPVATNDTDEGKQLNRRIEFAVA